MAPAICASTATAGTSLYITYNVVAGTTNITTLPVDCASVASNTIHTVQKRILVKLPKWEQKALDEFIQLINWRTNTGIRIELIIEGNVYSCDPYIEKLEWDVFVKDVLWGKGSYQDRQAIEKFVNDNWKCA